MLDCRRSYSASHEPSPDHPDAANLGGASIAGVATLVLQAILFDEAVGFVWRRRRRKALAEKEELKRLRSERPG